MTITHRVQKLISNYGYCSRRKAEELIIAGKVKVNGTVIGIGDKASELDAITVEGRLISPEKKVYIAFHKPVGCVTALSDPKYKTVMDFIRIRERIFPIGRLDYNTSGLLLLTNDGDFANSIMHPRYEVKKTYVAEVHKPLLEKDLRTLSKGVPLEDGRTRPAQVILRSPRVVEITIHEGKNRIVRRMLRMLGYNLRTLHRTRIGRIQLSTRPGQWCKLKHDPGQWPAV